MEVTKRHEFFRAMNRLRKFPHHIRIDGSLQFTEGIVLMNIKRAEEEEDFKFDVKKMQKFLNISQSAVSQTIAGLEEKNLIRRDIDDKDRRKFALSLTPLGRASIDSMTQKMNALLDEVFESISDEEIQQFSAFTQKLVEAGERVIQKHSQQFKE